MYMKVIELPESYHREAVRLSEYAFQYQVSDERLENTLQKMKDFQQVLGILDEEKLAAKLHILPLNINIGDKRFKMGGIAGVATYPEYRRNGYVKDLLHHTLIMMRERGLSISMLHPFSVPFYRKYGWELFCDRLICEIDSDNLVMQERVYGRIKRCTKESHNEDIEDIYQQYASSFSGMLVRDSNWWSYSVYRDYLGAVYYDPMHRPTGYMLYKISGGEMTIAEFVPLNAEARKGLWNFISQHDSMIAKLTITTHKDDPLFYTLKEPRVKAKVTPYFMVRIVDVEQFINQYPFNWSSSGEAVTLTITDSFASWNNKTFILKNKQIQTMEKRDTGIEMTINELSSILFGYKKIETLYRLEQVMGTDREIHSFAAMIPEQMPFFYDFF